jgi:hypothetical protein
MLREVERECCVSHAPEGRKYTDRVDRQTDIYIYVYTQQLHTVKCAVLLRTIQEQQESSPGSV